MNKLLFLFILLPTLSLAEKKAKKEEPVKLNSIKKVLRSDLLEEEARKKKEREEKLKEKEIARKRKLYNYPNEEDFWGFISEYWLTKNHNRLKWDFEKPDYGLDVTFAKLLQRLGHYEKNFKILLLDSSQIPFFVLPGKEGDPIYLLSVPFIRTLDLSKFEISLLLLQEYFRFKRDQFRKKIKTKEYESFIGQNFFGSEANIKFLNKVKSDIDTFIFKGGFSFQEQFRLTSELSSILQNHQDLWNAYYSMLKKVDVLVKHNSLYKDYSRIYPSPEMQLKWLSPQKNNFN